MRVYVTIIVRLASQLVNCLYVAKKINVAIFLDTMNTIDVKLCMMVVLIELYPCISLSVTLIVFDGLTSVKQF